MTRQKGETIDCGAFYLYRDSKSPYWQVRASDPKRPTPLWKSTKESDPKKAKQVAKEIYLKWAENKQLQPGSKILFMDLWSEFMDHQIQTVAWITAERTRQIGDLHLLPYFAYKFIDEIAKLWPRWLAAVRKERPTSPLFNERKYMTKALRYAHDHEYISRVPRLQIPAKTAGPGKVYSDDDIRKLITACGDHESILLQVLMGLTMGMRHGEICYLELDRIDLKAKTIRLGYGDKGTKRTLSLKGRTVRMSDEVAAIMAKRVPRLSGSTPWLFPQKGNPMAVQKVQARDARWSDLRRKAGVSGRFHDLRHTCATRLAKSGVAAEIACAYLGMSLRVYDSVYCHLNVDDTAEAAGVVRVPRVFGITSGLKVENDVND